MAIVYSEQEISLLRRLAERWMEIATKPIMKARKQGWRDVKDLRSGNPMIHLECSCIENFVRDDEIICRDGRLRNVEKLMRQKIRQDEIIGDDMVLEPFFQLAWKVGKSNFGIDIVEKHIEGSMAFSYENPIRTPEDIALLRPRTFWVEREPVLELKDTLETIFGDILPVRVGNIEILTPDEIGFNPLVGIFHIGIPGDVFRLIGAENMLYWTIEEPDALLAICEYLRQDRRRLCDFLEKEKIFDVNANGTNSSASSFGYCSDLPETLDRPATTHDLWCWGEAQETSTISPAMLEEFYLPAIGDIASIFGLCYYGCCEPIQDRMKQIRNAIPNLRAVSVSSWNNMEKAAEALGSGLVFSRKPNPVYISGAEAQWDEVCQDVINTLNAAKGMPLEFIIRDVYNINGELERLTKFVRIIREECDRLL